MRYGKFLGITIILLIFFGNACKKAGIAPLDEIINLEISSDGKAVVNNSLKADGKTLVKLVAYLPIATNETYKNVKFKISSGAFDVAAADKTEKTVYAVPSPSGDKLEAIAYFTLGRNSGNYTVSAQIAAKPDYKIEKTFETAAISIADMISFEIEDYDKLVTDGKLKSDGITKIKLIASIPLGASENERLIEFKTSAGSFDVTGDTKAKQVTASLQNSTDTRLKAIAYLTLGTDPGDYTLTAAMKNQSIFSAEKIIRVLPVKVADIIQVTLNPSSGVRANGLNLVNVQVALTNTTNKKVTLSTTDGVFVNSADAKNIELEVSSDGKAEANLKIGTEVKDYIITAKLSASVAVLKTISALRANPDKLLIEPSALTIQQGGSSINLDIFLKRDIGKVSVGSAVAVKSYQIDENGQPVVTGRFTGISGVSDADGKINMHFFADAGPIIKDKPIIVEVTALKDDGSFIVQKIEIAVKSS
jgi:hypothetical protein